MLKAAIMGFGTVGSGVYEIIKNKNFKNTAGDDIELKYILDIRDFPGHEAKSLFTKQFSDIADDAEVVAVAEVMGGLHPAYEFTKELLEKGKSVITSNKELVATYGTELLKIAEKNNVSYLFEASVGGGIPVIRPMSICLKANRIERIAGILNGTTNYILSEMINNGKSFDSALADAQEKGYAERNPAADIEGHDACRKIAILASLAWGKFVDYNNIPTDGICNITTEDVRCAEKLNSVIKLIGYARADESGRVSARVCPMLVSKNIPLAGVEDVFNAVMLKGDYLGDVMFYGKGAGKLPTASAVVADLIDACRHSNTRPHNIMWEEKCEMLPENESNAVMLVRTKKTADEVKAVFPEAILLSSGEETAFLTQNTEAIQILSEAQLSEKLLQLGCVLSTIRVLNND